LTVIKKNRPIDQRTAYLTNLKATGQNISIHAKDQTTRYPRYREFKTMELMNNEINILQKQIENYHEEIQRIKE